MKNGRSKGSIAEREVAALCKAWWDAVEPEAEFVRTPLSGGWHGPTVRREFQASGDLMTTAKRWPFTVEVKRRERWAEAPFRAGRASPVWGWWSQCCRSAAEGDGEPMLWMRRNRTPWLVMVRLEYARALPLPCPSACWSPSELRGVNVPSIPVCFYASGLLTVQPSLFAR